MKKRVFIVCLIIFLIIFLLGLKRQSLKKQKTRLKNQTKNMIINLPLPKNKGKISVEEAILKRRSIQDYKKSYLTLEEISQLLWSGQGITEKTTGFRAAPSAGASYPLEIYLVVGEVEGISPGIYHYQPKTHELTKISQTDRRKELYEASFNQEWVKEAPILIVITALFERTTKKYGERGIKYVWIEAGNVSQNIYLQAASLNLGTVLVGAFDDQKVKKNPWDKRGTFNNYACWKNLV